MNPVITLQFGFMYFIIDTRESKQLGPVVYIYVDGSLSSWLLQVYSSSSSFTVRQGSFRPINSLQIMLRSLLPFRKADNDYIFPTVDPQEDGPDCQSDCANCTVRFPSKIKIDTTTPLYGHLKPFDAHIVIATGKTDWARKIAEEKGSLAEAFDASSPEANQGVRMSSSPFPSGTSGLIDIL